jgi:hypothetical protein
MKRSELRLLIKEELLKEGFQGEENDFKDNDSGFRGGNITPKTTDNNLDILIKWIDKLDPNNYKSSYDIKEAFKQKILSLKRQNLSESQNDIMLNHLNKIKEGNKGLDKILKDRGYV